MEQVKSIIAVYESHCLIREVNENGISSPSLLSDQSLKEIYKFLNEDDILPEYTFKECIPNNVVRYNAETGSIVWFTEPTNQYLYFSTSLGIKDGSYPVPYLLWKYSDNTISVWALKEEPKSIKDKLYNAPFLNVFNSGKVCMGNVKINDSNYQFDSLMENCMKAFWNSTFTHTNHNNLVQGSIISLYEEILSKDKFPNVWLTESDQKLKDIINV